MTLVNICCPVASMMHVQSLKEFHLLLSHCFAESLCQKPREDKGWGSAAVAQHAPCLLTLAPRLCWEARALLAARKCGRPNSPREWGASPLSFNVLKGAFTEGPTSDDCLAAVRPFARLWHRLTRHQVMQCATIVQC
jgi:hypothetical protein